MSKMFYKIFKRFFDIIFSVLLLILTFPLLLFVGFLVWIYDKGEIFVKDPLRLGFSRREFRMYKFRSMIPNAHQEILNNPKYSELKKKWSENDGKLSMEEDIRVTPLGKVLRKTDVDELPQIINILKGDMSLVGPRPMYRLEIEKHLKQYPEDKEKISKILTVRPGLTGVWQVSGRNDIKFKNRVEMDAKYVDNMNFILDLRILLLTPWVVITRKGAHE